MIRRGRLVVASLALAATTLAGSVAWIDDAFGERGRIGRELSVPDHLEDGDEFRLSLQALLEHGRIVFGANWTDQDGGGRPLSKGTGRPLTDPSRPLTGARAFNRVSSR